MSETETEVVESAPQTRKKGKRQVADGMAHIHASFNNTIITVSYTHLTLPTIREV